MNWNVVIQKDCIQFQFKRIQYLQTGITNVILLVLTQRVWFWLIDADYYQMIDELLNKCAVVMKLLYLEDLKQIQIKANKIIVAVQVCIFRAGTMHVGVHWKPKCQCGCSSTIRRVVLQFVVILLFLCEYLVVLLWIIDQNTWLCNSKMKQQFKNQLLIILFILFFLLLWAFFQY